MLRSRRWPDEVHFLPLSAHIQAFVTFVIRSILFNYMLVSSNVQLSFFIKFWFFLMNSFYNIYFFASYLLACFAFVVL